MKFEIKWGESRVVLNSMDPELQGDSILMAGEPI